MFRRRAGQFVWAAADGAAPGLVPAIRRMELLLAVPNKNFDDLRVINNAVVAMNTAKQWDLAAQLADLALPEAPHNPAIYWACACAYAQTGRIDDALAAVLAAIDADYEDLAELRRDRDLAP